MFAPPGLTCALTCPFAGFPKSCWENFVWAAILEKLSFSASYTSQNSGLRFFSFLKAGDRWTDRRTVGEMNTHTDYKSRGFLCILGDSSLLLCSFFLINNTKNGQTRMYNEVTRFRRSDLRGNKRTCVHGPYEENGVLGRVAALIVRLSVSDSWCRWDVESTAVRPAARRARPRSGAAETLRVSEPRQGAHFPAEKPPELLTGF